MLLRSINRWLCAAFAFPVFALYVCAALTALLLEGLLAALNRGARGAP